MSFSVNGLFLGVLGPSPARHTFYAAKRKSFKCMIFNLHVVNTFGIFFSCDSKARWVLICVLTHALIFLSRNKFFAILTSAVGPSPGAHMFCAAIMNRSTSLQLGKAWIHILGIWFAQKECTQSSDISVAPTKDQQGQTECDRHARLASSFECVLFLLLRLR